MDKKKEEYYKYRSKQTFQRKKSKSIATKRIKAISKELNIKNKNIIHLYPNLSLVVI